MALIDQTNNTAKLICWGRGDSDAKGFIVQDDAGVAVNITGFSFKLTVNSEKNPTDMTNEQFSLSGVITDAVNGKVAFSPTTANTDITPTTYFYDIEQTDTGGAIKTLIKAKCKIIQDLTK
jgi:hypothetical protein